jgi:predicted O-methyltransferase YrrM
MRLLLRRAIRAALHTELGRRAITSALLADPQLGIEPLARRLVHPATFERVDVWPAQVGNFEDTAFLFSSNPLNMGIVLLLFEEAAYLHRIVHGLSPASTLVEVGRFKGGSTFLMAAAMAPGSQLWSYDLHVKMTGLLDGKDLDRQLESALVRYGLDTRVHLRVANSRIAEPPPEPCDLVFLDGDHSYEGVRADYEHWRPLLRPGGHLLFHDAAAPHAFTTVHDGVARLVTELERDPTQRLARQRGAGSLAHFSSTE